MTINTATPMAGSNAAAVQNVSRVTAFGWLLRSEWGKLWSVRSTYWCVAIAIGLPIVAAIGTAVFKGANPGDYKTVAQATYFAMMCSSLTSIPLMLLGLLAITSEYRAKAIHATLAGAPGRLRLLAVKSVIIAALSGSIGLLTAWASVAILTVPFNLTGNLTDVTICTPLVGRGLNAMILAAFALALGALLRSTAAGIVILLIGQLTQPIAGLLPGAAGKAAQYLPTPAGDRILTVTEATQVPAAYQGLLIFALWTAVLLALAGLRLRTQDA